MLHLNLSSVKWQLNVPNTQGCCEALLGQSYLHHANNLLSTCADLPLISTGVQHTQSELHLFAVGPAIVLHTLEAPQYLDMDGRVTTCRASAFLVYQRSAKFASSKWSSMGVFHLEGGERVYANIHHKGDKTCTFGVYRVL